MISFKILLDISQGLHELTEEERLTLTRIDSVYIIVNDIQNVLYIGETEDTWTRVFDFWKKDKRHVDGKNAPIYKYFFGDYENTYFDVIEFDCDHKNREFYWHDWYKLNTSYKIVSRPGRPGLKSPCKGRVIVNNGEIERIIVPELLEEYLNNGWVRGITPAHSKRNSEVRKGKKLDISDEGRKRISEANSHPKSPETRKRISESKKGTKFSESTREYISRLRKGKKHPKYKFIDENGDTFIQSYPTRTLNDHPTWKLLGPV